MLRKLIFIATLIATKSGISQEKKFFNLDKPHVKGEFIIKFKPHSFKNRLIQLFGASVKHHFKYDTILVSFPKYFSNKEVKLAAELMAKSQKILHIEANSIVTIDERTPNDPDQKDLWGLQNILSPHAWEISVGLRDVLVGIIDTGVDYTHQDLAANYWTNPGEWGLDEQGHDRATNGIDDDKNGFIDDYKGWDFANDDNDPFDDHGHGTHCAGTIGAVGDNDFGIVGVNWKVSMVGLKFLTANGSGTLANAIKAIDYATDMGIPITNNSWGGAGDSPSLLEAIERANNAGSLFVAAAGNRGSNNDDSPHYPSSYEVDNVIAVAATNRENKLASFSQWGPLSVDIAAPGEDIISTIPNNKFGAKSGTSMATPHVSGALALAMATFPKASHLTLKNKLISSVTPTDELQDKTRYGGILNLQNLLEKDDIPPSAVTQLEVINEGINSFIISFHASGDDQNEGRASRYEVKISDQPILNHEDWQKATVVRSKVIIKDQKLLVKNLPFNSHGFFTVRAFDNVGNISPIEESKAFNLPEATLVASFDGDVSKDIHFESPWGVQQDESGNVVYSDSPFGNYGDFKVTSMTMNIENNCKKGCSINFRAKLDLEFSYDHVFFEYLNLATGTWQRLLTLTGLSYWKEYHVDLNPDQEPHGWVPSKTTLRFRLASDGSINNEGILIDDINIFGMN